MKIALDRKQWLLIIVLIGYSLINLVVLSQEIVRLLNYRKVMKHNKIGYQFDGLQQYLKGQDVVGYYSDTNIKTDAAGKLFAQAQFMLTPVILDPENLNHQYIILACKNPQNAFRKIKELGAAPLLMNQDYGVILAKKP